MSLEEQNEQTLVKIDPEGVSDGEYEVILESYNTLSSVESALMTDIIAVTIKSVLPKFSEELPQFVSITGVAASWALPSID